jgi:exodeoxyribonuclease-5
LRAPRTPRIAGDPDSSSPPGRDLIALLDRPEISSAILSGPAGSGKTTLTASFIREAGVRGLSLAITAPTHKALRVLRGMLERSGPVGIFLHFTTLHSILGLRLSENEDGSFSVKPGPAPDLSSFDWIIVDECSLVGRDLLREMERARGRCRVLFVGDPHQLPPVESMGASSQPPPVFTLPFHRISLDRVHRQEDDHPVHHLTRSLLAWKPEEGRPVPESLFPDPDLLAPVDLSDSRQLLWVSGGVNEAAAWADELRKRGENVRILAYTNRRVELYNRLLFRHEYGDIATPFARNERVFLNETTGLRNDEDQSVIIPAGEELTVLEIFPERHPDYADIPAHRVYLADETGMTFSVLVPDDSGAHQKKIDALFREVRQKKEGGSDKGHVEDKSETGRMSKAAWSLKRAFAQLRHGYSMTVFKAQGSTFESVIVDWQDLNFFRDDHAFVRGLYVAATRPSHRLIFAGTFR